MKSSSLPPWYRGFPAEIRWSRKRLWTGPSCSSIDVEIHRQMHWSWSQTFQTIKLNDNDSTRKEIGKSLKTFGWWERIQDSFSLTILFKKNFHYYICTLILNFDECSKEFQNANCGAHEAGERIQLKKSLFIKILNSFIFKWNQKIPHTCIMHEFQARLKWSDLTPVTPGA